MFRTALYSSLGSLLGLALTVGPGVPHRSEPLAAPAVLVGQALAPPDTRREGGQALEDAVAAAVIGSIATEFDEPDVAVRLDKVAVEPASLRDRRVTGAGRIRFGGPRTDWLPFRFEALYDTQTAAVTAPHLVLATPAPATALTPGSEVTRSFVSQTLEALKEEFGPQRPALRLEQVFASPAGEGYLRVEGQGTVDFGREGLAGARVEGLYEPTARRWLRLRYELGSAADWSDAPVEPLAGR